MSRAIIERLIDLLNDGFDRDDEHSLLGNIRSIDEAGWRWKPPSGGRSIAGVIWHAGAAKYLYWSHAFGDGGVTWEHPLTATSNAKTMAVALPWIREAHGLFIEGMTSLADDEALIAPRRTHWGMEATLQFAIDTIIRHDVFHAGEVNHIRALMQGNDRWGYFGPPISAEDS
jgi:uncharacterized damage-inducible protein DinB